jgi:hypothetical protein
MSAEIDKRLLNSALKKWKKKNVFLIDFYILVSVFFHLLS